MGGMSAGALFSQYFLDEGIVQSADWKSIDADALETARAAILLGIEDFDARHQPDEGNTETDFIRPLLTLLGWEFTVQERINQKGRADVPDYLMFLDANAKAKATKEKSPAARYQLGVSIVEAKRWSAPLDRAEPGDAGAPSTQVLRYLGTADVQSNSNIRFGILTNGRYWRLYDHKARSRLEGFVEIDLKEAVGLIVPADTPAKPGHADHVLRQFLWLFGQQAFVSDIGGGTRLTRAVSDSRSFEARVTDQLANTVFGKVFPELANALWEADPDKPAETTEAYLAELREAALTWLYRLLFVLYAEDRNLLPTRARRDGLWATRNEVARALDENHGLSDRRTNHDGDLRDMWRQIDTGDDGIGLPPYNGGLFKAGRSALLDRAVMPDKAFAPLLDALSREHLGDTPRFINYRDLSVQHLGSVYERLLEFDLAFVDDKIAARPQTFARKTSGSYYTPEELVMLVIRRTIGPLLDEKRKIFADAVEEEAPKRQSKEAPEYPIARLQTYDPATEFLTLRICDPAMGSGHFLVSLVDYLADQVMLATTQSASLVEFGDYRSPLLDRLETIRERIKAQATEHGWRVDDSQLIDRQLVRRIILKRVIHGVDKNPMAVELAKLSLWLHTFTVGAPLSFLDHHLRCGDSLFGEWVRPIEDMLLQKGVMFLHPSLQAARNSIAGMARIEELTDADITEVQESTKTFEQVTDATAPLSSFLAYVQAWRWVADSKDWTHGAVFDQFLLASFGDPVELAQQLISPREPLGFDFAARTKKGKITKQLAPLDGFRLFTSLHDQVLAVAADEKFMGWQASFPSVWNNWSSSDPDGGFDAVIGNPPWAKVELEAQKWFAGRNEDIVAASTNKDREALIRGLKRTDRPLFDAYQEAKARFAKAVDVAQDQGSYPLFSSGRPNLYQLFFEQALKLVSKDGLIGLLVPSGIISDRAASAFARHVAPSRRIKTFLDFENRRPGSLPHFFSEVDSRFKLAVTVVGGINRTAQTIESGFFLVSTADDIIEKSTVWIDPNEFEEFNPNTGTAMIFRDVKDASVTRRIYAQHQLLRSGEEPAVWPIRYSQMLNQSNSSGLFRDEEWLSNNGWYPTAQNRWSKGDEVALPLYEGKMVQAFDHRAADIEVNPKNRRRPGQPKPISPKDHSNISRYPSPQFFIESEDVPPRANLEWMLAYKDITAVTNERTMIASVLPRCGAVHALPVLLPLDDIDNYRREAPTILANLNSFAFDYFARQKVQAQHLSWYIVEQLPVIPPAEYSRKFGKMTAREIVAREVLHLTYTAHDMAAFARDMGYDGDPFIWDDADRRQRRARLDALYFQLYSIGKEDADYILSTFSTVCKYDKRDFNGRYVTRDLILAQMDALAAGDTDAVISLR